MNQMNRRKPTTPIENLFLAGAWIGGRRDDPVRLDPAGSACRTPRCIGIWTSLQTEAQ